MSYIRFAALSYYFRPFLAVLGVKNFSLEEISLYTLILRVKYKLLQPFIREKTNIRWLGPLGLVMVLNVSCL